MVKVNGITNVTDAIGKDASPDETWVEADVIVSCYGVNNHERNVTTTDTWKRELAQGWYWG